MGDTGECQIADFYSFLRKLRNKDFNLESYLVSEEIFNDLNSGLYYPKNLEKNKLIPNRKVNFCNWHTDFLNLNTNEVTLVAFTKFPRIIRQYFERGENLCSDCAKVFQVEPKINIDNIEFHISYCSCCKKKM